MNWYHLLKLCHIVRAFLTRFHFEIKINNSITFFKLARSMISLVLLTVIITFRLYIDKLQSLNFLFVFFFGGGGGDYVLFIYDITASFKSSHQYMSPKLPVIFFVHQTEARFKILMSRKQNLEDIRILWWLSTRTNRICSYTLYMYMYLVLLLLQHKKICTTNNYASDDLIGRS